MQPPHPPPRAPTSDRAVRLITSDITTTGGSNLWGATPALGWRPQRGDDGILELVGFTGFAHLAAVKLVRTESSKGLRSPNTIRTSGILRESRSEEEAGP